MDKYLLNLVKDNLTTMRDLGTAYFQPCLSIETLFYKLISSRKTEAEDTEGGREEADVVKYCTGAGKKCPN